MFRTMSTEKDRRELIKNYLHTRQKLKQRFRAEELQDQDAAADFEKQFKPLLEPTKAGVEATKGLHARIDRVVDATEQVARKLDPLMTMPQDLAAAIPQQVDTSPMREPDKTPIRARPQKFNEEGRRRIEELGTVEAARQMPPDWNHLLLAPSTMRPREAAEEWPKWVWREWKGARQARGPEWDEFLEEVRGVGGPPAAARARTQRPTQAYEGRGLKCRNRKPEVRYYDDPVAMIDRLEILAQSVKAGNTSLEVRNEASSILDKLLRDDNIDDSLFEDLWKLFE